QEPRALGGAQRPRQKLLVEGVRRRRIPCGRPPGHREQRRYREGRRALPERLDRLLGAGPVAGVEQGLHESDVDQVPLLGLPDGRVQRPVHLHRLRGAVGAVEPPAEMQERRGEQRRRRRVLHEVPERVDRGAILAEPTQALAEPEPGLAGKKGGGAVGELRPRLPGLLPPAQEREGERATASSRDQERLRRGPRPTERAVEGVEGPRGLAELEGRPAARVQGETGEVVGRPLLGDLNKVLVGLRDSVDLIQGFTEPVARQSCGLPVGVLAERVLEVLDGLAVPPVVIVLAPAVDERADAPEQGPDQVAADGAHRDDRLRDRRVEDEPRGRQRRERRGGRRDRQLRHWEGRLLEGGPGDLDERDEVGGRQNHRRRGGRRGHERGPRKPEQQEAAHHDSVAGFFSVGFCGEGWRRFTPRARPRAHFPWACSGLEAAISSYFRSASSQRRSSSYAVALPARARNCTSGWIPDTAAAASKASSAAAYWASLSWTWPTSTSASARRPPVAVSATGRACPSASSYFFRLKAASASSRSR